MIDKVCQTVLACRAIIGLAQGVLMERCDITADEAFERLWQMSNTDPVKTLVIARDLVNSTV